MKKIAVISMGVKLDNEKGYSRFRYIGEFLSDAGYQVDLITTTFQHWEKAQRNLDEIKKETINLIKIIMSRDIRRILICVESEAIVSLQKNLTAASGKRRGL